jgi:asparaginyl-tRNA synthetase
MNTHEHKVALFKIASSALKGARKYVNDLDFHDVSLQMPHIVGVTGACENVSTLFKVDYFGKEAFLAQSNQLYLELWTPYLSNVCCLVRSFRAEPDVDARHQTEFGLFELEMLGDLDLLIERISGTVRAACNEVVKNHAHELETLFGRKPEDIKDLEFKRITYVDAVELLKTYDFPELQFGDDLKADHELRLTELLNGPIFITHYPKEIKFFNMKDNADQPGIVNSTDLILPLSGESAGAAERETDIFKICEKLLESSMYRILKETTNVEDRDFDWYLNAHLEEPQENVLELYRQHIINGTSPLRAKKVPLHSGTGIGMDRVMQFIIGSRDIRKARVYPRNAACLE